MFRMRGSLFRISSRRLVILIEIFLSNIQTLNANTELLLRAMEFVHRPEF
jgi:hypothetical protein